MESKESSMQTQMPKKGQMSRELERSLATARALRGLKPDQVSVRVEEQKGRAVRIVREERHNVPVPNALKGEVHHLFVKRNSGFSLAQDTITAEVPLGNLLVIAFHKEAKVARGIKGLPVTKATERKLRKDGFSHVTIHALPQAQRDEVAGERTTFGYDERAYGISFYKPKAGHRDEDGRGGELVYECYDELAVMQWICENGLAPLFEVRALSGNKILPLTDEARAHENAIIAQMQMFFGRPMRTPHPEAHFHHSRLFARLLKLNLENVEDWDADGKLQARSRAEETFSESFIGKKVIAQVANGTFACQVFYQDQRRSFAYGIFNLPDGARYVMAADYGRKQFTVEPIPVDMNGVEVLEIFGHRLESDGFVMIDWRTFSQFVLGMGTAIL